MAQEAEMGEAAKPLSSFEGEEPIKSLVRITNTGDGLSEAVAVDNVELHRGDKVYVLLAAEVTEVAFPNLKGKGNEGLMARRHTLKAGSATLVASDLAVPLIMEQESRIRRAKEELAGITQLFPEGETDDEDWDEPDDEQV